MAEMGINEGKGLHFTFDNGIRISIQIGRGNYCDNYDWREEITRENPLPPSRRAEIAVWSPSDELMIDICGDLVKGYVPVDDVLRFVEFLRSLPSDLTKNEVELAINPFDWRNA